MKTGVGVGGIFPPSGLRADPPYLKHHRGRRKGVRSYKRKPENLCSETAV